jgi:hypothetical protein
MVSQSRTVVSALGATTTIAVTDKNGRFEFDRSRQVRTCFARTWRDTRSA